MALESGLGILFEDIITITMTNPTVNLSVESGLSKSERDTVIGYRPVISANPWLLLLPDPDSLHRHKRNGLKIYSFAHPHSQPVSQPPPLNALMMMSEEACLFHSFK